MKPRPFKPKVTETLYAIKDSKPATPEGKAQAQAERDQEPEYSARWGCLGRTL